MRSLIHSWLIARKDLKLFFTDRLALFFFILFPFFFVLAFNALLSSVGTQDNRLVLNIATQEEPSGLSNQIISVLETKDESQLKPGEPKIVWLKDYAQARQLVENKELAGFLAFPADFTNGIMAGYGATLEVITEAEESNLRAALNGLARSIAAQIGAQRVSTEAIIGLTIQQKMGLGDFPDIQQAIAKIFSAQGAQTAQSFISFNTEKIGEVEAKSPVNYVIPGYLVMFVFFAGALSAESIVKERQNHTLERILTRSVKRESVLFGIFLGTAAKGIVQIIVFWLAGIFIFHIDMGQSPTAVILLSLLTAIMAAAFSLMLATLVKTQRAAGSLAVLTSLILAPLGGCWWPLFITPRWMQFIAGFTPHGWATTGFNKLMLFGASFSAVAPEMLVLAGFAVLFGIIGIWRFRLSPS